MPHRALTFAIFLSLMMLPLASTALGRPIFAMAGFDGWRVVSSSANGTAQTLVLSSPEHQLTVMASRQPEILTLEEIEKLLERRWAMIPNRHAARFEFPGGQGAMVTIASQEGETGTIVYAFHQKNPRILFRLVMDQTPPDQLRQIEATLARFLGNMVLI